MKVIDFWSGDALLVRMNWRDTNADNPPWWPAFIQQSCIAKILGWVPNEVHCYDRVGMPEAETKQPLMGDVGKIILHSNQRRLPKSVDMICAFNPDPRVVFGNSDQYDRHILEYSKYIHELAHMVNTRLRVGGILAVQFDKCMISPEHPYDWVEAFLARALPDVPHHYMKWIWHVHKSEEISFVQPFRWLITYELESLHLFQKVLLKK